MEKLTVGKLRKALENVPDELEVELWSSSGVDQSDDDSDVDVVVEDAFRHQFTLPEGKTYEDGTNSIDYFVIYANFRYEDEIEED